MNLLRRTVAAAALSVLVFGGFRANVCLAQVSDEVVVGVTPTCPYGLGACAVGAREGLLAMEGVKNVAAAPNEYNCTIDLRVEAAALPDLERWKAQFREVVGDAFVFRGVELTVSGRVVEREGTLHLRLEDSETLIALAPLEHKLQWNFRKSAERQPEPGEMDAYRLLREEGRKKPEATFEIIGPLRGTHAEPVIEVREFYSQER